MPYSESLHAAVPLRPQCGWCPKNLTSVGIPLRSEVSTWRHRVAVTPARSNTQRLTAFGHPSHGPFRISQMAAEVCALCGFGCYSGMNGHLEDTAQDGTGQWLLTAQPPVGARGKGKPPFWRRRSDSACFHSDSTGRPRRGKLVAHSLPCM